MIISNSINRKEIVGYLESIDEDTFIEEFIIPIFRHYGFSLYRINVQGPGEHGKDVIFTNHRSIFLEQEFVVVQAKAEKINTKNVTEICNQLVRSYKTPILLRSGVSQIQPNYVVLMNSRRHSNDVEFEFPPLIENKSNIKILSQEQTIELVFSSGIVPGALLKKLSVSDSSQQTKEDELVINTILANSSTDVDALFDHKIKFLKDKLSPSSKKLVLDYIFDLWLQDRSWENTVKPMKWLKQYFEFIQPEQSSNLIHVFEEYTSKYAPWVRSKCPLNLT